MTAVVVLDGAILLMAHSLPNDAAAEISGGR